MSSSAAGQGSQFSRREILALSAAAAAALCTTSLPVFGQEAAPKAQLKLCSQEGRLPGKSLGEKLDNLEKFGGNGIEFGGNAGSRIKEIKEALSGRKLGIAAICAGYFTLIDPEADKRKDGAEKLKKVLDSAGELGSTGVIVVPAFNKHPQLDFEPGRKVLAEELGPLGEYAHKAGTRILLEPLNRGEAHFLNRLETAAGICKEAGSPGACMMGDFYHMCIEEKDDEAAFVSAGAFLHHVHLASRKRNLPGQDDRSFVAGFRGLKKIGFQDFCSLECGCKGDPLVEIPKAFELLRKQWDEAVV